MMKDKTITETVKCMRCQAIRMERQGDYWTDAEKRDLEQMFFEGIGISEIAVQLQRTEPAIWQQIEKMDLYGRQQRPQRIPRAVQKPECLCRNCRAAWNDCPRYGDSCPYGEAISC
jgi:hypothetical protein